ncbi:hypothetical protein C7S18_23525 (plasmid) [Ahniella affigens]|uniref:Uncharacterized protein n=1 Tax=Ahniella affigens TaxID=2021234 RepID=A0A2P1PZJ9_9GAMM|nr:hypothetical protein C7S18_23525 [Ahniella affigens]
MSARKRFERAGAVLFTGAVTWMGLLSGNARFWWVFPILALFLAIWAVFQWRGDRYTAILHLANVALCIAAAFLQYGWHQEEVRKEHETETRAADIDSTLDLLVSKQDAVQKEIEGEGEATRKHIDGVVASLSQSVSERIDKLSSDIRADRKIKTQANVAAVREALATAEARDQSVTNGETASDTRLPAAGAKQVSPRPRSHEEMLIRRSLATIEADPDPKDVLVAERLYRLSLQALSRAQFFAGLGGGGDPVPGGLEIGWLPNREFALSPPHCSGQVGDRFQLVPEIIGDLYGEAESGSRLTLLRSHGPVLVNIGGILYHMQVGDKIETAATRAVLVVPASPGDVLMHRRPMRDSGADPEPQELIWIRVTCNTYPRVAFPNGPLELTLYLDAGTTTHAFQEQRRRLNGCAAVMPDQSGGIFQPFIDGGWECRGAPHMTQQLVDCPAAPPERRWERISIICGRR